MSLTAMRVTFDTNVWNRMVLPEKWISSPNYDEFVRIKSAIRNGRIRGFISEGFATAESIGKRNRAKYHVQSVPAVEVAPAMQSGGLISMSIEIKPRHDQHPGIGEDFEEELTAALAIGIKLLHPISAWRFQIGSEIIRRSTQKRCSQPPIITNDLAALFERSTIEA
jgi:hypothetical protein